MPASEAAEFPFSAMPPIMPCDLAPARRSGAPSSPRWACGYLLSTTFPCSGCRVTRREAP
jgi:hypothetical protein